MFPNANQICSPLLVQECGTDCKSSSVNECGNALESGSHVVIRWKAVDLTYQSCKYLSHDWFRVDFKIATCLHSHRPTNQCNLGGSHYVEVAILYLNLRSDLGSFERDSTSRRRKSSSLGRIWGGHGGGLPVGLEDIPGNCRHLRKGKQWNGTWDWLEDWCSSSSNTFALLICCGKKLPVNLHSDPHVWSWTLDHDSRFKRPKWVSSAGWRALLLR